MYKSLFKEAKKVKEETNVKDIIDELIDTGWSGSNDEQGKAVQLLKGLAFSDDPLSNKFMKELDKASSNLNKDDFKEAKKESEEDKSKKDDSEKKKEEKKESMYKSIFESDNGDDENKDEEEMNDKK